MGEEGEERGVTDNSAYHETAHVEFSLAPMGHRKQPNVLAHLLFQSRSKNNTFPSPPIIRFT